MRNPLLSYCPHAGAPWVPKGIDGVTIGRTSAGEAATWPR